MVLTKHVIIISYQLESDEGLTTLCIRLWSLCEANFQVFWITTTDPALKTVLTQLKNRLSMPPNWVPPSSVPTMEKVWPYVLRKNLADSNKPFCLLHFILLPLQLVVCFSANHSRSTMLPAIETCRINLDAGQEQWIYIRENSTPKGSIEIATI